jgi:hypothetical protein
MTCTRIWSRTAKLSACVILGCFQALAAAITGISVANNSSPNNLIVEASRIREFRTEVTTSGPALVSPSEISFTNRVAWMSAHRVLPPSGLPLTWGNSVAYDILFTIEDPLNIGYTLEIDSAIRGYVTAEFDSNLGVFPSTVFASGTLMAATLDTGSGFGGLIPAIMPPIEVATATATNPFANELVEGSGTYNAGFFTGTRSFVLRYSTIASNTGAALQNFNTGEANVRFGLDPLSNLFQNAAYPGADGETADQHGHFVTIRASFEDDITSPAPIPEPGSLLLMSAGFLLLGLVRRRG